MQKQTAETWADHFGVAALPAAILFEVFFKLPIISAINCKLVCKAWYRLISSSDFTYNYAKNSSFTSFVFTEDRDVNSLTYCDIFFLEISENGNCIRTSIKLKLPGSGRETTSAQCMCSCNGLLCLLDPNNHTLYISNPITEDCVGIPDDRVEICYGRTWDIGFSTLTNRIKVMRISYGLVDGKEKGNIAIFTIGVDNEWRSVVDIFLTRWSSAVFLNGAFHFNSQEESDVSIPTFDIEEEKVGQIFPPPALKQILFFTNLVVLGDNLCLIDHTDSEITIWRMEEYGVAESWTKVVLLSRCFPSDLPFQDLRVVSLLQNGDILLSEHPGKSIVSYSFEKKTCTKIRFPGSEDFFLMPYIPSFVSPKEVVVGERGLGVSVNVS